MNEAVTTQRPMNDFEEFERFMRDSAHSQAPRHPVSQAPAGDPLSELARLVGHNPDPYGEVFAHQAPDYERAPGATHPGQAPTRPPIDFAAIEAGLRGTIPAHQAAQYAPADQYAQHPQYAPQADAEVTYFGQPRFQDEPVRGRTAPPRSRRPIYAMAAVIVAGVVGVGVAFAYKGSNSGPREIAMIKAAPGPTKIQPPADETVDQPVSRDASILDKAQQPAPTRTVSREEQPVDLAQSVQQNAPRDVGNGITPLYNFGFPSSGADAASVPVPTPPGQADDQKPMDASADIKPIRVKTRSYRPDGTPIPNDQPPVAAADQAAPVAPVRAPVAKASTPKVVAPKSTTRVAPKPIVTADAGDVNAPTDLTPAAVPRKVKVKPAKPVKTATAAPVETRTAETRTAETRTAETPASETQAADATQQAAAPSNAGGAWAVQLAAPGSEAEAKQASTRLSQKFESELSGHDLSFHKAIANGRSVYRVRAGGLSREEANEICGKLKASGGGCFVAKN